MAEVQLEERLQQQGHQFVSLVEQQAIVNRSLASPSAFKRCPPGRCLLISQCPSVAIATTAATPSATLAAH